MLRLTLDRSPSSPAEGMRKRFGGTRKGSSAMAVISGTTLIALTCLHLNTWVRQRAMYPGCVLLAAPLLPLLRHRGQTSLHQLDQPHPYLHYLLMKPQPGHQISALPIINASIASGSFPSSWKWALVEPIQGWPSGHLQTIGQLLFFLRPVRSWRE